MQRHGGSARWYLPHDTCANYHIAEANHWQLCKHIELIPSSTRRGSKRSSSSSTSKHTHRQRRARLD